MQIYISCNEECGYWIYKKAFEKLFYTAGIRYSTNVEAGQLIKTCSFSFSGEIAPVLQWLKNGEVIGPNLFDTTNNHCNLY